MSMFSAVRDCWFVTGPTAGGKTAVALALAGRLNAEIVSLDSMALYRGMDIGTAKPSAAERAEIPHHLIDVVDPGKDFSTAQYLAAAQSACEGILARGRVPLFVGGTALYLKALLRGMFEGPPADWTLRRRWSDLAQSHGPERLHAELASVDPTSAARLHANDTRRVIRALEVHELTGMPISVHQSQFDEGLPAEACRVFVLRWPREELHQRIDARVDAMFAAGLVDEVRALTPQGPFGRTAQQALGYREVLDYLAGKASLVETIDAVKQGTRQFAKRQMTWFRSLSECRFIDVADRLEPNRTALEIAEQGAVGPLPRGD